MKPVMMLCSGHPNSTLMVIHASLWLYRLVNCVPHFGEDVVPFGAKTLPSD